ncbi:MAG: hypothetical protein IK020_10195 [Clostridiales bacterium]|nr:hypothetical protein [Clostridiales bacterium]
MEVSEETTAPDAGTEAMTDETEPMSASDTQESTSETIEETATEDTSSAPEETTEESKEPGVGPVLPTEETEPSDTTEETVLPEDPASGKTALTTGQIKKQDDDSILPYLIRPAIVIVLLLLAYLRYRHLEKEDKGLKYVAVNFIPVIPLINKIKGKKTVEQDETTLPDEAKPVVMNGYLQKPTVGASAAQAIRPIRSNISSRDNMRPGRAAVENRPEDSSKMEKPEAATQELKSEKPAPVSAAPEKVPDSELPEMVKAQRELEKRMKYLEKEMKRLPNLDDGTQNP